MIIMTISVSDSSTIRPALKESTSEYGIKNRPMPERNRMIFPKQNSRNLTNNKLKSEMIGSTANTRNMFDLPSNKPYTAIPETANRYWMSMSSTSYNQKYNQQRPVLMTANTRVNRAAVPNLSRAVIHREEGNKIAANGTIFNAYQGLRSTQDGRTPAYGDNSNYSHSQTEGTISASDLYHLKNPYPTRK